jgi:hypothetical protein
MASGGENNDALRKGAYGYSPLPFLLSYDLPPPRNPLEPYKRISPVNTGFGPARRLILAGNPAIVAVDRKLAVPLWRLSASPLAAV